MVKKALIKSIIFSVIAMVIILTRFYLDSRHMNRMLSEFPALVYQENIDYNIVNFRINNISTWGFLIPQMVVIMVISYIFGFCINVAILYISAWFSDESKT